MDNQALRQHWQQLSGKSLGTSDWLKIDQSRIDAFADATIDHQVIHIDPDAPATNNLGGTIAHGFLSLSLLSYFIGDLAKPHFDNHTVLNYGLNQVRFLSPVPCGASIRLHSTVSAVTEKDQGILITMHSTIEISGAEKPALVAEQLVLLLYH